MKSQNAVKYSKITLDDAKANPEYWRVIQNMYHEQSARIIQRAWRKTRGSTYKGKYSETLNGPLSLQFIKEPLDDTYKEHAQKIKHGQWLELNFDEPEFVRNLYKALRLRAISVEQLGTALLLSYGREQFKDEKFPVLKSYSFKDAKGPYQPKYLSYPTAEDFKNFDQRLEKIPEGERCYFTITFPKKHEIGFLYCALIFYKTNKKTYAFRSLSDYEQLIEKCINKTKLDSGHKKVLMTRVNQLFSEDEKNYSDARANIIDFLLSEMNETKESIKEKEQGKFQESIDLLIALLTSAETQTNLYLTVSPDYNKNDPNSSLICLSIPTVSAFKAFQRAMHGEKHTTDPFFTAGQFGSDLVRELDEHPEKFGMKQQSRPVEIAHPDLISYPTPHGYKSYPFINTWHDYALHTSRCSVNRYKPLMRYLGALLRKEKGFDMSTAIFALIDMDGQMGVFDRERDLYTISPQSLAWILKKATSGFFFYLDTDSRLLVLIDMIIHQEKWKLYIGKYPDSFFDEIAFGPGNEHILDTFQQKYADMKEIITRNKSKSTVFYILAYHLRNQAQGIELLQQLDSRMGLDNIFTWHRNNGLHFDREYGGGLIGATNTKNLSDFEKSPMNLFTILTELSKLTESKELFYDQYDKNKMEQHSIKAINVGLGNLIALAKDKSAVKRIKKVDAFSSSDSLAQLLTAFREQLTLEIDSNDRYAKLLTQFNKLGILNIYRNKKTFQIFKNHFTQDKLRSLSDHGRSTYFKIARKFRQFQFHPSRFYMPNLESKQCTACKKGTPPLSTEEINKYLAEVNDWEANASKTEISRRFTFAGHGKHYGQNIKLVSLISEVIMKENHHPRIVIEYNTVEIFFTTHATKGLTANDFICAAKINKIIELNKSLLSGLKEFAVAQPATNFFLSKQPAPSSTSSPAAPDLKMKSSS